MAYHDLGREKGLRLGETYPLEGISSADEAAKHRWLDSLAELGCEKVVIG
jgi:hypothetical protein